MFVFFIYFYFLLCVLELFRWDTLGSLRFLGKQLSESNAPLVNCAYANSLNLKFCLVKLCVERDHMTDCTPTLSAVLLILSAS